jgi:hypothetical protein
MNCEALAYTGTGVDLGLMLILALTCLVVGAVILVANRHRGGAAALVLLLLVGGTAVAVTVAAPAQALAAGCPTGDDFPTGGNDTLTGGDNFLTVVQTSVMDGMAPGVVPVAITGIVSNNGTDSTYLTAVDVAITGVVLAAGSAPGTCDASDYVLLDARMPVGRTLEPGASTGFAGASIGFSDKVVNQDACQSATVQLRYIANPR